MKPILPLCLGMLLLATPAAALEVTNLDTVDHRILFETAGNRTEYVVPVDRTVYIPGQPNGRLSLLTAKNPSEGSGVVQSDGLLSGIIGNGRSAGIPAETNDSFVIWKDGKIAIQQRRRGGRFGN